MSKRILIVDDEEFIVENLQYLLEDLVDKVFTALRGTEALDILKNEEIHCVISDIYMPGMDGIELIKEVRALGNDVPFIFFSAHGNNSLMLEAVKYGAFDFLDKPNFDGLEDVVKRGLEKGFKMSQVNDQEQTEDLVSEYQKLLNKSLVDS